MGCGFSNQNDISFAGDDLRPPPPMKSISVGMVEKEKDVAIQRERKSSSASREHEIETYTPRVSNQTSRDPLKLSLPAAESTTSGGIEFQESVCSDSNTESSVGTPRLSIQKRTLPQRVDLDDDDLNAILEEAITFRSSYVELNHHELEVFPELLYQTVDWLQALCASHNNLSSVPSSIGNYNHLSKLSLSHNNLSSLPLEIGCLGSLAQLDVSYNKLSSLPSTFSKLQSLRICNFDFNKFVEFPTTVLDIKV